MANRPKTMCGRYVFLAKPNSQGEAASSVQREVRRHRNLTNDAQLVIREERRSQGRGPRYERHRSGGFVIGKAE